MTDVHPRRVPLLQAVVPAVGGARALTPCSWSCTPGAPSASWRPRPCRRRWPSGPLRSGSPPSRCWTPTASTAPRGSIARAPGSASPRGWARRSRSPTAAGCRCWSRTARATRTSAGCSPASRCARPRARARPRWTSSRSSRAGSCVSPGADAGRSPPRSRARARPGAGGSSSGWSRSTAASTSSRSCSGT